MTKIELYRVSQIEVPLPSSAFYIFVTFLFKGVL